MKSFQIGFNGNDETEFDVETEGRELEDIICELVQLFNSFCDENNFGTPRIDYVYETEYDGEES